MPCLFELRFYKQVNQMVSCQAWSVYLLTTLLLGKLSPLSGLPVLSHSFTRNWQMPFLNQRKGENDHRKYFMINLHERMLPAWSNLLPPDHQSDVHPTTPPTPAKCLIWSYELYNNSGLQIKCLSVLLTKVLVILLGTQNLFSRKISKIFIQISFSSGELIRQFKADKTV